METKEDLSLENINFNVIFLDIDGVINSAKFINDYIDCFKQPTEKTYYITEHIDPRAVKRVNILASFLNAKIVISSAWRKAYNLSELKKILRSKGLFSEIIGETKVLNTEFRGHEIQQWMNENNVSDDRIVILDDNNNMAHLTHRLILTSFDTGFLDEHFYKALELFNSSL